MNFRNPEIPCPQAGGGVHRWLLGRANQCRSRGLTPDSAADVLAEESRTCGRRVPSREIADAVNVAFDRPGCAPRTCTSAKTWPKPDPRLIQQAESSGLGLPDLWEASPIRIEDNDSHTEQIIDLLFPRDPLLCCGWAMDNFDTRPREAWRGDMAGMQLIVPSPMSKVEGITKDGRLSRHCLDNTGPRKYLVVEFDQGTPDQHAARLLWLAERAPLVLVVHSGGKSLHGWFRCRGASDGVLRKFMRVAVMIGGDPATWTRSQFVRMPDGQRDNGKRQTVFYVDQEAAR